jgi:hypothetical protein
MRWRIWLSILLLLVRFLDSTVFEAVVYQVIKGLVSRYRQTIILLLTIQRI